MTPHRVVRGRPVRLGVIGSGHWAQTAHLPAITEHREAVLAALSDPDRVNLSRASQMFGPVDVFLDHEDMLDAVDVDGAVIATPHLFHHDIAIACLAKGLHVLIEKPMTLAPEDAEGLVETAQRLGLHVVVSYPWHYNEQAQWVRRSVEKGRIGRVRLVSSFFASTVVNLYRGEPEKDPRFGEGSGFFGPQRHTYSDSAISGGGQGQTQLTHAVALGLFLTGLTPSSVSCFMSNEGAEVDVIDALTIRFDGGSLGSLATTGATRPPTHTDTLEYRIYGTDGHIHFEVSEGRAFLYDETNPNGYEAPSLPPELRYPAKSPARNLIDLILGRGRNQSPGPLGATTVRVLSAAYASADAGGAPQAC